MNVRLAAGSLLLVLACAAPAIVPASARAPADAVASTPVRGVWTHPGFFGPERTAAIEKMRATLDEYVELNPALPAVREYEVRLMLELSRKYAVDWIHLDYARYPCEPSEPYFSYDSETLRLFRQDTGIDMTAVKSRDTGNMAWNEWLRWNTDRVTIFVRELRQALIAAGSKARISAAVFPDAVNARVLIGQDWPAWAREGLVDMLCPMLYSNNAALFGKLVREAVAQGQGRSLVCAGIGIGTSHNQNTVEGMIEQMEISRSSGADGVVFFSSGSLNAPFLERLKSFK